MDQQQRDDQLLASAVTFLMDGGDEQAAMILLSCTLTEEEVLQSNMDGDSYVVSVITLTAPRVSYDALAPLNFYSKRVVPPDRRNEIWATVKRALRAVTDEWTDVVVKASLVPITAHWREELFAILRGDHVTNQGLPFAPQPPVLTWNNLRFRSQTEIRIAQELDRRQVLFLPNCLARLGFKARQNHEADFLICAEGKWGILEVDGDLAHPPTRTAEDHERDRLFHAHGILLVQHFAASECWENADGVVRKFLELLKKTK
jgi:hypothetical protein